MLRTLEKEPWKRTRPYFETIAHHILLIPTIPAGRRTPVPHLMSGVSNLDTQHSTLNTTFHIRFSLY